MYSFFYCSGKSYFRNYQGLSGVDVAQLKIVWWQSFPRKMLSLASAELVIILVYPAIYEDKYDAHRIEQC